MHVNLNSLTDKTTFNFNFFPPLLAFLIFYLMVLFIVQSRSAQAEDLYVQAPLSDCRTNYKKHTYCSLSQAIDASIQSFGTDVIQLTANKKYIIDHVNHVSEGGNGLPAISDTLIIQGNGAVIERASAADTPQFRLFRVTSNGSLSLKQVTLRNGATARGLDGAAIWNTGKLVLEQSTLEDNHSGDDGGAIRNDGVLRVYDTVIRGNSARWRGGVGGGVQTHTQFGKADTLIERTTFEDNEAWAGGGALWIMGDTVINHSTLTRNRASERGGGIVNYGDLELRDSQITRNQAGVTAGGLFSFGDTAMEDTVIIDNQAMIAKDCDGRVSVLGRTKIGDKHRCNLYAETAPGKSKLTSSSVLSESDPTPNENNTTY